VTRTQADRIIDHLANVATHPLRAQELASALRIRPADRRTFRRVLRDLVADGRIVLLRRQRFAVPDRVHLVTGTLRITPRGHAFLLPDRVGSDLYIPTAALGGGLDGDRVAARLEGLGRNGRAEGRVVRIIERARSTVVGRWSPARSGTAFAFVVPEDRRLGRDILVGTPPAEPPGRGELVVVRITDWGDDHRSPVGTLERVLGEPDAPGVDVLAIIYGHELPTGFDEEVVREAARLRDRGIRAEDLEGREDLRDRLVLTIDPPDARDHDDALSIRDLDDGTVEVGVHIADVSFYVRQGTALDREAFRRATSVYLVDRAIPMLPEALSSDLCSLVPDRDRLTLTAFLTIDATGRVIDSRIAPTVIRSRHRLTYGRVQQVFEGISLDEEADHVLTGLRDVSRRLRARRVERGSLDFDLPETRVFLDEAGVPVDIQRAERWDSHRLVEDLMLAANEAVGGKAAADRIPFIYRIHEPPDPDRLAQLVRFALALGFEVRTTDVVSPADLQAVLQQKPGTPAARLLATLALRTMKQARYSGTDLGHYGLAARGYTHFTSPIRRYPDLLVHRIVAARGWGRGSFDAYDADQVEEIAVHSSLRERVAADAERDSILLKKLRFMRSRLGSVFDGTISDIRPFGLVVLLDAFYVEGLVHVSALGDDYYEWIEERFLLVGQNSGRRFKVGQPVRVQVASVDTEERRIDFILVGTAERRTSRGKARRRRK
jgi:ribonuclease R